MNLNEKNDLVKNYYIARNEYDLLSDVFMLLCKDVYVQLGLNHRNLSNELESLSDRFDELYGLYEEAGYINGEGINGEWDEDSLASLKNERRIFKIERALAFGESVNIPDGLRSSFPPEGPEFDSYVINLEEGRDSIDYDRDFRDEIKNIRDGILDDFGEELFLKGWCYNLDENIELTEDTDGETVKQLLINIRNLWMRFEKSVKELSYAF